jgi:hypothetical protein
MNVFRILRRKGIWGNNIKVCAKDWKTSRGVTFIHHYLEENHIEKPVIIYILSYFLQMLVHI